VSGFEKSPARRGLDWLLELNPHLELVEADWQRGDLAGPWLLVGLGQQSADGADVFAFHRYAIFKRTGAVHGIGVDGAVTDDPLFVPA
jgi:hypothetical protein